MVVALGTKKFPPYWARTLGWADKSCRRGRAGSTRGRTPGSRRDGHSDGSYRDETAPSVVAAGTAGTVNGRACRLQARHGSRLRPHRSICRSNNPDRSAPGPRGQSHPKTRRIYSSPLPIISGVITYSCADVTMRGMLPGRQRAVGSSPTAMLSVWTF
jgi:hypothetical protein